MTMSQFFRLVFSRIRVIVAAIAASLLLGAAVFILPPKSYPVSTVLEVRLDNIGPYSRTLPFTIKHLLDTGAFDKEIALKAGLRENEALPRLEAKVIYTTQLLRVHSFATADKIERTKAVMDAMTEVLRDKFPKENVAYFGQLSRLNGRAGSFLDAERNVEARLKKFRDSPEAGKLAGELDLLAAGLRELSGMAANMLEEGRIPHAYGVTVIVPPAASNTPVGPTTPQVLIAFALLGFFTGLAAAFWLDERDTVNRG
jgi:hypothetical protein